MKRLKAIVMASMLAITCSAQSVKTTNNSDSTIFKGYLYNKEYDVYIQMDFYHNNIVVPYQEIYGEMPGYFGDKRDGRKWLFTNATIKNKHTAIGMFAAFAEEIVISINLRTERQRSPC